LSLLKVRLDSTQREVGRKMDDLRLKGKLYAVGVINELKQLGYTEIDAKRVFLQHYRGLKRNYGLNECTRLRQRNW